MVAAAFSALIVLAALQGQDGSLQPLLSRYQTEPRNALLCEQIGVTYTRLNDFNKAAAFFQKAVDLDPQRVPAQKNLATVLWFLGRKQESAALFGKLEKRIPDDPVPQLYLGLNAYDARIMETAAAHFERAGTLASGNPETLPFVVESYLATRRYQPVIQLLERGDADSQSLRWLGDAYDGAMLPEKASEAYSKAIEKAPNDAESYLALAGFAIEHASPSYARDILNRGLQQTGPSARLLLEMGLAWAIQGDFESAKKSFSDANAAEPKWSIPLLALGVTELQTGHAAHAAECFRQAKATAPQDYRCYYLHALALERSSSEDAAWRTLAVSELQRAIALQPQRTEARIALAQLEIGDGHQAEAETQLRAALRISPNDPNALYKLALLCRREGKTQEAAALLRTFQESKSQAHAEENEFVMILKTVKQ